MSYKERDIFYKFCVGCPVADRLEQLAVGDNRDSGLVRTMLSMSLGKLGESAYDQCPNGPQQVETNEESS